MRGGFTLVETLVALVLFQVGMLALVATTGVVTRDLAAARRSAYARMVATNRLELLRARGCGNAETQRATWPGGYTESWSIEEVGWHRALAVVVAFPLSRDRQGQVSLRGEVLCLP